VQTEKVETALEAWLLTYQGGTHANRRFFVGPLPHERLGQAVVAVIEGRPFADQNAASPGLEETIRQQLQPMLTPYEAPRNVYFVDQLLETPTGKIDRRSNLQRIASQSPVPG
jgi:O-succinylbenzoic acid--CoA ligase